MFKIYSVTSFGVKRKLHLVKWDTMLLHNLRGGLAIWCPPTMNCACLVKMGWEMKER